MDYFLKQVEPGNPYPLLISLHEDDMKIGRSTIASLSRYNRVSRYHATFTKRNENWFITDLGSLNFLYVNLERIQHTVKLNVGDIIGFGSPNVSQDGGFVCVLAARSKVTVKQESFDDDCVEIPTTFVPARNTITDINKLSTVKSSSRHHVCAKIDEAEVSNIQSRSKDLKLISSASPNFQTIKTESTNELSQNVTFFHKIQACASQSTLKVPATKAKLGDNINSTELANMSKSQKMILVNHVPNIRDHSNDRLKYNTESTTNFNLNSVETCSKVLEYNDCYNHANPTHINTQNPVTSGYPDIEYLEEFISNEIIISTVTSKDTDVEKCEDSHCSALPNSNPLPEHNTEANLNSVIVKQEIYSKGPIPNLDKPRKVKSVELHNTPGSSEIIRESNKSPSFQNSESFNDRIDEKTIVKAEPSPKQWTEHSFDQISSNQLNDLVKSKTNSDSSPSYLSESSKFTAFTENTFKVSNADKNILSLYQHYKIKEDISHNLKEDISHSKRYAEGMEENAKSCLKNLPMLHTQKQNFNGSEIGRNVNLTNISQFKTSTVNNLEIHTGNNHRSQLINECSSPLMKGISENNRMSLNVAESNTQMHISENKFDDNSSDLPCLNSSKEAVPNRRNSTRKSKHLNVSTTLKVRKNKILSSESETNSNEYEEEKELSSPTKTLPFLSGREKKSQRLNKQFSDNISHISSRDKETKKGKKISKSHSSKRNRRGNSAQNPNFSDSDTLSFNKETIRHKKNLSTDTLDNHHHSSKKSTVTDKRKRERHWENSPPAKRRKTNKAKDDEFGFSTHSTSHSSFNDSKETHKSVKIPKTKHVHSKRRYYDYSDEFSPSRSPPAHESTFPPKTKSKSLGRTLLIESQPIEYRSRRLRGREEWFQERYGAMEDENSTQSSMHSPSSRQKDLHTKTTNTETGKNRKSPIKCSQKRILRSCCQKKKEKEIELKNPYQNSDSQNQANNSKGACDNSQGNMQINSCIRKRAGPPVPTRKNKFCSRMGFLIDTPVKCDKKLLYQNKQKESITKKQDALNRRETTSPKGKKHLDLPQELVPPNHKTEEAINESLVPTKSHIIQTSKNSEANSLVIDIPHSFSDLNEDPKTFTKKQKSEKHISVLEFDSKSKLFEQSTRKICAESSTMSDKVSYSNSNTSNNTRNSKVANVSHNQQFANESTKSYRNKREKKQSHVSSTLLMEMIVNWNTKWLVEQKNNKNPPPLIAQGATFLNLSFSSYESYASSYFPLIALEVWECLFKESSPHLALEQLENCNNFCFTIKSWENRGGLTELQCESVVSDALCYQPTEGKIVLLDVKDKQESGIENYSFGCIRRHSIEDFKRGVPLWDGIPVEVLNDAKLVKFEVVVKKCKRPTQLKSVYLAHGLLDIREKLQMADALRNLRNSTLCKDIYHPREETLMFSDSSRETLSWTDLIQEIIEEVQNPISKSSVLLLHAPPGTGKTRCVVELANNLAFGNPTKTKILVCAPSYTALDDILFGLVKLNENCNKLPSADILKFVKLGEHEGMCSNLIEYSLARKVAKLYREDCVKKMQTRECTLKLLEEKINEILFKQQTSQDTYSKINKSSTLTALVDKMKALKDQNLLHPMDEGFRKGYECIILKESDVLLSTLECSVLPTVGTFLKDEALAYCVVDDATQCNELQLLQCLQHAQISKIILFGDSHQLKPTTVSKHAAKCGFSRSIFERFILNFRKKYHKVPYPAFKNQYRMHSEICHFPSKYFYNRELSTAEGTDEKYARFPLKPYVVLDILDPGPIPHDTESSLIMYICSVLIQVCPTSSLGIVVDDDQKKSDLPLFSDPEHRAIEVNTVQCLQGREKDIILIPCLRQSLISDGDTLISCKKMLNVAVTRAKQCLIICGQVSSHVHYPHWRALMDDAMLRNCYLCVASVTHLPLVFTNYIKKV